MARSPLDIFRSVVFALFLRELKGRLEGQWLGLLWLLLEPVAHVAVLLALFGSWRQAFAPGLDYTMFLVTGLMPFFIFRGLATRLMDGIDANRALFAYRQVKPIDALIARALLEFLLGAAVALIILAVLFWLGHDALPRRPLELFMTLTLLFALGTALGLVLAVVTLDYERSRLVVRVLFLPLYILSGIIMPMHTLPRELLEPLLWNPVLHLIELARAEYLVGYIPLQDVGFAYPAAWTGAMMFLAVALYRLRSPRLIATT